MPTYQYACTACDHRFEAVQAFTDPSLTVCPECAGRLRKVYGSVGVVFKGSGFYHNDSRADAKKSGSHHSPNGTTKSEGSTSDGTSGAKSDAAASSGSATSGSESGGGSRNGSGSGSGSSGGASKPSGGSSASSTKSASTAAKAAAN